MTYVQPHLITAHASLIHAPTPHGGASRQSAPAQPSGDEWKITGRDKYSRPDDQSEWDPWQQVWTRKWLPGEKEAEAQQRIGDVKNAQQMEMLDYQQMIRSEDEAAKREAAQKEWDRQHAIVRRDREQAMVDAGTHEWGYTPEQQREIAKMQGDFDAAVANGTMTDAERDQAQRDMQAQIDAMPKHAVRRTDAEAAFRENTFTDAQGRIFSRDGKLVYNPLDAEAKRAEFGLRRQDAEEKRYMDALMRLQQGYRTSEPVYGDEKDDNGNPVVDKWHTVIKPYTDEQRDAILRQMFPGRYANVPPPAQTASVPLAEANPMLNIGGAPAPEQAAPEQTAEQAPPAQTAEPPPKPAAQQPTAQPPPPPDAPPEEKRKYAAQRWGVK